VVNNPKSTKLSWKERKALSDQAVLRLKPEREAVQLEKVLAVHAKGLSSPDAKVRKLSETLVQAYKDKNTCLLIRCVNQKTRKVTRLPNGRCQLTWAFAVPMSWMHLEVSMLHEEYAHSSDNELLLTPHDLCFGVEAELEDFEDYMAELELADADETYEIDPPTMTEQSNAVRWMLLGKKAA